MIKFEENQAYSYGYACNASSCVGIEVIKRTEKTVTIRNQFGEVGRRKIMVWNDVEVFRPEGNYSMAPVVMANHKTKRFWK